MPYVDEEDGVKRVAHFAKICSVIAEKEETQDELWSLVEDVVLDVMIKYYGRHSESINGQLAFNIKEALKSKFTITRK